MRYYQTGLQKKRIRRKKWKIKKVALVTGAGQGIGAAVAKRLSTDGFKVAVSDLNLVNAKKVAEAIKATGNEAIAIQLDVTDRDAVFAAVETTTKELGDFNVMVNNAGVAFPTPIDTLTQKDYDLTFNVNVQGVLWGIQAASLKMKEIGHGGRIISASSQAGVLGNPGLAVYCASKFAVRGLTQTAAKDLASDGINVTAYAPGIVATPMFLGVAHKLAEDAGQPKEWGINQFAVNTPPLN